MPQRLFLLLHMSFSSIYLTKLRKRLIVFFHVLTILCGNHCQISKHTFHSINMALLFLAIICICFVICVTYKFNCKYTAFLRSVWEYVIDWLACILKHVTCSFVKQNKRQKVFYSLTAF